MLTSISGVYSHIPANLRPPEDVNVDGQAGITESTYALIQNNTLVELGANLDVYEVPVSLRDHPLLNSAAEMFIAARILRRIRTYQEVADSLFADANVQLRLFYQAVAKIVPDVESPELVYGEGASIIADGDWLPTAEAMTYQFKEHPLGRDPRRR